MDFKNKKLVRILQVLFGLWLLFTSVAGFLPNMPQPQFNEAALAFMTALFSTGYMFYLMALVFFLSSIAFIFNKWTAFSSVLLAPISLNILLFHLFLDMTGILMALLFVIFNLYFLAINFSKYKPMFSK